ncbi:MAG: hypothetical protein IPL89_18975 [Acidobacteria bacterium]|nr:hypothetical protein [Acidobacteriota bacterium]
MSCKEHGDHAHRHGDGCGHKAVRHGDHADYLHDGHLHAPHEGHADEHRLDVSRRRPGACAPVECTCPEGHASAGHAAVPHGDHVDYDVNGALHHPHGSHCDLHGKL